jgi:uncharacterized membrane protein
VAVETVTGYLTVAAAVGSGLVAGLFFTFSVVVMPALARLPPTHGAVLMQTINRVILRPLFLTLFVGTAMVCAAVVLLAPTDLLRVVGAVLYMLGAFGVTMVVNVPLNNVLDAVAPESPELPGEWTRYTARWTPWNHVRTVASTAAALALGLLPAL